MQSRASSLSSLAVDLRSPTLVSFLDLARWLAAAIVFVGHLRNPLFLGYGDVAAEHRTVAVQAWYFVTGWHAEAVIVFFVLSGLLVGAGGLARWHEDRFDPAAYSIDRVTRLYLPFLPALLVGFALDQAGSHFFSSVGFWDHSQTQIARKIATEPFGSTLDARVLIGNMLMLQHYFVPALGSNQPLWTISAEFWFYAVFLLFVLAAGLARKPLSRIAALLFLVAVCLLLGSRFVALLGLWGVGVVIALAPAGRWRSLPLACVLLLSVMIAARLFKEGVEANVFAREVKNYAVAVSFAYLICCMRGRRIMWLERLSRPNAFFASFSYSLYLLHFPLMLFLLATLHATGFFPEIARGFDPSDLTGLMVYFLMIVLVSFLSWLFSLATESQTGRVRLLLRQKMGGTARHAPPRS